VPARSTAACGDAQHREPARMPGVVYLHGMSLEAGGTIPNDEDLPLLLDRVYPSHEIVKIDYFFRAARPRADAIWEGLKALLTVGCRIALLL